LITADAPAKRAYYNITQSAELLGVSRVSIWRWIRDGRLEASRLGHRTIRIERAALERILAENGQARGADEPAHVVQFFESDAFLFDRVTEFVGSALRHGGAGIVIATEEHRAGIEAALLASGVDLDHARTSKRYVALDAAETLAGLMIGGAPDRQRFHESVGRLVAAAGAGGRRVGAFGEMVALLAAEGKLDATIRLEELWNELQQSLSFSLLCAYPMRGLGGEALGDLVDRVCACHSRVTPAESYAALGTEGERARAVAVLQQKAESLETALAAERAARAAAEDALRLRDEFLQIAAHELRTPVTSLRGYAQLLLRRLEGGATLDPERLTSALQLIVGQGTKLTRLVSQLLDVARYEAGKLAIESAPTDLAAVVTQAVDAARGWSDRHTLSLETCDRLVADVDALRLEQVLANLLDNAVKYSPAGGPIQVTLRSADPASAEIAVRDGGLGLPTELLGRIFERFYQAHHDAHLSGMGLGLHISRQIVELHGGEIWAESPPGGGARFVLRVPISRG
jgi:excisionase family DNA binding protein